MHQPHTLGHFNGDEVNQQLPGVNMQSLKSAALLKFDQEEHKGNAYQAFQEFISSYAYEYDAVSKEPPKELEADVKTAWIEQNKRKLCL